MPPAFALAPLSAQGAIVYQRPEDGYINATAMCQAAGKRWNDYSVLASTKPFLDALATETGIPVSGLAQSHKGGDVRLQGTWVHPQVAINLAQWCSPEFAVKVSHEVPGVCRDLEIFPLIVQRIPVDVVDHVAGWRASDKAMKLHDPSTITASMSAASVMPKASTVACSSYRAK